ncbi:MAG: hypothetical protein ACRD88_01235, partial [Terriglobia bacterium]
MTTLPPEEIDTTTLYMIFLRLQAADAQARSLATYRGASIQDKASRMHVNAEDIPILDQAAKAFVAQAEGMSQEAFQ